MRSLRAAAIDIEALGPPRSLELDYPLCVTLRLTSRTLEFFLYVAAKAAKNSQRAAKQTRPLPRLAPYTCPRLAI
jgi:hypothetical protein